MAVTQDVAWGERAGWSFASAMAAGVLVLVTTAGVFLLDEAVHQGTPAMRLLAEFGAPILLVGMIGGGVLGVAMAFPVYLASRWAAPRNLGWAFAAGAVAALLLGFGALALALETASLPLFGCALLAATGLGGVFFMTRIERWAEVEPCAS